MARQRREVVVAFVGQDELSDEIKRLNNELNQVNTAGGKAGEGVKNVDRASANAKGNISAMATTTRFAAVGFVSELNPALGTAVSRMTSMSTVASQAGASLRAGLVVGGIAVAITALGLWIKRMNEATEEQVKLNRQVREFDASGISSELRKASADLELLRTKLEGLRKFTAAGLEGIPGMEEVGGGAGTVGLLGRLLLGDPGEIERRLGELSKAFDEIRRLQFPAELAKLQAEGSRMQAQFFVAGAAPPETEGQIERRRAELHRFAEEQRQLAVIQMDAERTAALARAETLEERERILVAFHEREKNIQLAHNLELQRIEKDTHDASLVLRKQRNDAHAALLKEFIDEEMAIFARQAQVETQLAQGLRQIQDEFGEQGLLAAVKALGPAIDANVIQKFQELEDPAVASLRAVQQQFRDMQKVGEEFARSTAGFISSTLFDALEGRIEDFGDFFKRSLINLSRELVESQIFSLLRPGGGGFRPFDFLPRLLGIGGTTGVPSAPSVLQTATPLPPGLGVGGTGATVGGISAGALAGFGAVGAFALLTIGLTGGFSTTPSAHEQNVQAVDASIGRIEAMMNNPNVQRLLDERPVLANLIEELVRIRDIVQTVPAAVSRGAVELLKNFLPQVERTLAALASAAIGPEEVFRRLADAISAAGFSVTGIKTGRTTSLQLGQALGAAAADFPILARLATEGPEGLIADEQRQRELAEMQRKIDELAVKVEEVEALARQTLQVGSGLLGRTVQGMTAYDRLRMLEQEMGLLIEQRQTLVESMG